ncbi:two-component system, chemotaxis family, chemotaxis protein CheY [Janthinobacterium sp. CG_23.3]|uniref:response regulator n=1 Tax=unclassified Janthinobacterium TaxID=2610881 RepID=UPI000349D984|nr:MULTISPECIES: response regulator [unclassified Janthinobacterium]MEC5161868.1 CheY-like chemotaxis protein [Janthinobacterium sp. CG_S6]
MSGAAGPGAALARLRVLLVDDDALMLDIVGEQLRQLGVVEIATAADGAGAIAAFDQAGAKPDLVVADLQMPGVDGFQLLTGLAERRYDGGVILLSGQEDRVLNSASLMAQFHQLRVLAALPKPPAPEALARAIGQLG